MGFITDDFLLSNNTARRLYHEFAEHLPIVDYHTHLPPHDIAGNRQFTNLAEIWLEGDHYKWRLMRANGEPESVCTGDAPPYEKFLAWARTVPHTLRNPLYHWTHLELKRYFDIDCLLTPESAEEVWKRANARLSEPQLRPHGILERFNVLAVCTTDDPADDLSAHRTAAESELGTAVLPTFRPDRALAVDQPEAFRAWLERLEATANTSVNSFQDLKDALRARHDAFHEAGCRLSDHGLPYCFANACSDAEAERVFQAARSGKAACRADYERYAANLLLFFGELDAEKGWTKQLHLGPIRNVNTRLFRQVGPDAGCDSIGDWLQAEAMAGYLDALDRRDALPRMVVYNVNPAANYVIATMIGNFQGGGIPGKLQYGAAWWYLDQKEGMQWQMNTLSNTGLFTRFLGMLTDSRSFLSFTRHEYFRRVLCDLLGRDVEAGEIPPDDDVLKPLIEDICFRNALRFLRLPLKREAG
ncbi:MAG: glucuronate isomerase [Planctomycetota bacterium]|nr:MAG: glucuronate isomerase [Planctomycetota bacterium]